MTFTINSTALTNALSATSRVVPKKTAMPILENIKLEIPGQCYLNITASDGDTTLVQRLPISTEDTAYVTSICVMPKTLLDPLQSMHDQTLTIDIDDLEVTVKYATGQFKLVGTKAEEFPERKKLDPENSNVISVASQSLINAISRSLYAVVEGELRSVMRGIYFDLADPSVLTCVATDSKKLVRINQPSAWKGSADTPSFIMPRKMAALVKSIMTKECGDCEIRWDASQIAIRFASTLLVVRGIEGKYPRYNAVIPKNNSLEAIIDSRTLQSTLKRMLSFADASTGQVVFDIKDNACTISSRDIDFNKSAQETLACNYPGSPIRISFSAPRLIEVLGNLPQGDIRLTMSDPTRPALIFPFSGDDDIDILSLIMPMAITE